MARYERALATFEAVYGSEHLSVAGTLGHMGLVLQQQGRLEEATARYERALAILEAVYGSEHTQVATTLGNMGDVLRQQGQLDEAMACWWQRASERRGRGDAASEVRRRANARLCRSGLYVLRAAAMHDSLLLAAWSQLGSGGKAAVQRLETDLKAQRTSEGRRSGTGGGGDDEMAKLREQNRELKKKLDEAPKSAACVLL